MGKRGFLIVLCFFSIIILKVKLDNIYVKEVYIEILETENGIDFKVLGAKDL